LNSKLLNSKLKNMELQKLFTLLWEQYSNENPSVKKIHELFRAENEEIVNDHIAFRTFNDPRINIEKLAQPFLKGGYIETGNYTFPAKKLVAKHYEHPELPNAPRIFISELLLEELSPFLQNQVKAALDRLPNMLFESKNLVASGPVFSPCKYDIYERFREESEYAAWLYAYGFRANHFTVSINHLERLNTIELVNDFIKSNGYDLNGAGGEIKGTPAQLLEQSSTLADRIEIDFMEGTYTIPACYYEFARRYEDEKGELFSGFIAGSADKIFESTDFRTEDGQ